jgi:hypothetical protein
VYQHFTGLLAGRQDQRCLVLIGGHDTAHGIAKAGAGMEVHDHRLAQALGKTVGDTDHAGFLQRQHIVEVGRKVFQESLFGRARVADDGGQPELAKQIESDVLDGAHETTSSTVVRPGGSAS